jgi:hypothetical protein
VNKSDPLLKLVQTLSSKEQSHFVKHLRQHKAAKDSKLLKLFRLALRQAKREIADYETASQAYIPANSLPPMKHTLYRKLLRFLAIQVETTKRAEVSRMIDEANLLINRGLIKEARKIAKRAEKAAEEHGLHLLRLELSILTRRLFRQFATQALQDEVRQMQAQATQTLDSLQEEMELQTLYERIYLHKRLNEEEQLQHALQELQQRQQQPMPKSPEGRIFYYLSSRLLANTQRDYEQELHYSQQMAAEFERSEAYRTDHLPRYLRTVNNLINSYFRLGKMAEALQQIKQVRTLKPRNFYQSAQLHSLVMSSEIIYSFLTNQPQIVRRNAPDYQRLLDTYQAFIPHERYMEICYNTAVAFLSEKRYDGCLDWLNRCLSQRDNLAFREQRVNTQVGANVETRAIALRLIAFYELGQEKLLRRFIVRAKPHFKGEIPESLLVLSRIPAFLQLLLRTPEPEELKEKASQFAADLKQQPGLEEFAQWVEKCFQER